MIDGLVHQFAQAYNKYGMQLIADNYVLKTGAYIRLNQEGEIIWINLYDQKEGRQGDEAYEWFALRDYNSTLLAMNKPIDSTKKIHSNNYLTFFMKKDVLIGKDALDKGVLQESIDTYYQIY